MSKRFHVVDALRGFAIISIMLLHNIEHFDFYHTPESLPAWMVKIDSVIWDTLFFLFGGKSFAIFALLFGLTFFIQINNQQKKGNDFRPRFAWRMFLLLIFGIINSAFFQGDILMIYAVIGLFMIPLAKLKSQVLVVIAAILLLQPLELFQLVIAIQNPDMELANPTSWTYFGKMSGYITDDSLWTTLKGNLFNGRRAVLLWNYENGRYFQILALFIIGYLMGRKNRFEWNADNKRYWLNMLLISALLFMPLFVITKNMEGLFTSAAIRASLVQITQPWTNLAFMFSMVSLFILLFHSKLFHKLLNIITPIGKMSLTNYVLQSIIGSFIYYGFGLGLYEHTGATYSLIIGIVLSVVFIIFCSYWDNRHKHGPLEALWHKLTWIGYSTKPNIHR
ncbi:DUF418 domain-containing protein [Fulvivirga maritima]|uniref:DUF418 domain-containing protein n=1 Tax=Fulvivirga maritima TaxID=2904247 RepID=UPI001F2F0790|nr:DUF418 domain-containing protein [Fulvivirga maritima]UII25406.1 DUF418 domain-containing protein [Fulvivirga maritima]